MDNYKQNNGEQSNNTELCPATAPALSLYHIISERKQKNKLDDGTLLITLQSWRLDQDH